LDKSKLRIDLAMKSEVKSSPEERNMAESDNMLLRRFADSGDAAAFSEIVRQHAGPVYGACLRVLEDQEKASDAVQDTFLQLLRDAGRVTDSLSGWLHRVATRKAVDQIRQDLRRQRREAKYAADKPVQTSRPPVPWPGQKSRFY
jgi:DNA-directed RNA polymerase specialized sigma24 family protein